MKSTAKQFLSSFILFLLLLPQARSQEVSNEWMLGIFAGTVNYQGDIQRSSFTFDNANPAFAMSLRKPLGKWFSFKTGFAITKIEAADKNNRDYLVKRNLSFYTSIKEFNIGLELNILDITTKKFSPYLFGGLCLFHFNPWTFDENGAKIYLKPLGTEGQGLTQYPDRKPYNLIQPALGFGGGARFALNENINIGLEFTQRKSFTDYLDDVSTNYADYNLLFDARGIQSPNLAFRGDELPGGQPYPHAGEQRGTPTEMDWYYFIGMTVEVKLSKVGSLLRSNGKSSPKYTRCPKF